MLTCQSNRSNCMVNYGWGWSKSRLLQLIDGSVKLAIHDKLTESDQATSYVFLDNDIFTLKQYMMKAYLQQSLALNKTVYNYDHNRVWRISEDLFGNFADRWKIYFTTIPLKPDQVWNLILSTLVLSSTLTKSKYSRNAYFLIILEDLLGDDCNTTDEKLHLDHIIDSFYHLETPRNGHNATVTTKSTSLFSKRTLWMKTLYLCSGMSVDIIVFLW